MTNNPQFTPDFLNYNVMGYRPVKTTFNLDTEQVESAIMDIGSKSITGIRMVTSQWDRKTGAVGWFIWFDSKSEHFYDNSTNNTAIGQSIRRYSQEFQEFAKKFGWRESDDNNKGSNKVNLKGIVGNNMQKEMNSKLTYLQVALNPFLIAMFDAYGNSFSKEYNKSAPKVFIDRKYMWLKGSSGDFHKLVGVQVEKTLQTAFKDYSRPKANRAGSFN